MSGVTVFEFVLGNIIQLCCFLPSGDDRRREGGVQAAAGRRRVDGRGHQARGARQTRGHHGHDRIPRLYQGKIGIQINHTATMPYTHVHIHMAFTKSSQVLNFKPTF